jgi:hypothetical protein
MGWNGGVSKVRHTCGGHAEAHAVCDKWNARYELSRAQTRRDCSRRICVEVSRSATCIAPPQAGHFQTDEDRILPEIASPGDLFAVVEIGNRGVDSGRVGTQRGTFVIFGCGVAVVYGYNFPVGEKRRDEEGRQSEPKEDSSHGAIRVADAIRGCEGADYTISGSQNHRCLKFRSWEVGSGSPIHSPSMRYWWVNQNQTFRP